jgi:hypothetical protein
MPPIRVRNLPDRPFTQLPKAALLELARQLALDTTGTVLVLRARIRQHIDDNPVTIERAQLARLFPLRPLPGVPDQINPIEARGPNNIEDEVDDDDSEEFPQWNGIVGDEPGPDSPRSVNTAPMLPELVHPPQRDDTSQLSSTSSSKTPHARGPRPSSRTTTPAIPPFSESPSLDIIIA